MTANTVPMTSAGSSLAIAATLPSSVTKTAYAALTPWVLIGEITDAGNLGRTYNTVQHKPLASRGVVKIKGSFDDGTMALVMALITGDAGQILVETALSDDNFYSFKLTLQNGNKRYFQAMVSSAPEQIGGVDQVTGKTVNLDIKSGTIVKDNT